MFSTRPLHYRLAEGATSFLMPIGFLMGGGSACSILFFFYILHSLASFLFHLQPSKTTYWLDTSLINMVILERMYLQTRNLSIFIVCWISMMIDNIVWEPHWGIITRAMVGVCIVMIYSSSLPYDFCLWSLTFLQSVALLWEKDCFHTTLTCCLYHLYLGVLSGMEVSFYLPGHEMSAWGWFFRHVGHLTAVSMCLVQKTTNAKRLRSVLSLLASFILTPLSFYQLWRQSLAPDTLYRDSLQNSILLFYVAYCVADMVFGYAYYPQYFGVLDGWAHHIATSMFALYFLWKEKDILFCIGLVLETSSILLCMSRVFYDVPWVRGLRDRYFKGLFVGFRILLPTLLMVYFYPITMEPMCVIMYVLSTIINTHWLYHFRPARMKKDA